MDRIYRRPTQVSGTPKKKKNEKNRVRNTILNFRVTPTEKKLIEARMEMTGLPKAEFLIESCLYQAILVKGNITTFSRIREKIRTIAEAIDSNPKLDELDPELAICLGTILEILNTLFGKEKQHGKKII